MGPVKVSVLMPAYNVARYIEAAIRSVLAQRGVAFELLLGDDGSTDGTWGVIQRYRADPRVRAWRFRRHRGAAVIRNHLAAAARGRYLSFTDADDLMLPGNLARLSALLDVRPAVGVAYGNVQMMDSQGRLLRRPLPFVAPRIGWDLLEVPAPYSGTMVRRTVFDRVGGHSRALPFMIGYDLLLRLSDVTQFHHLGGPPLYRYRRRCSSLSDQPPAARARLVRRIRRATILRRYGYTVPW